MEVIKSFFDPYRNMDTVYAQALAEAKERGATKMVIVMLKDDAEVHDSKTFKTSNLRFSECVSMLEIAKSDLIEAMRGRNG